MGDTSPGVGGIVSGWTGSELLREALHRDLATLQIQREPDHHDQLPGAPVGAFPSEIWVAPMNFDNVHIIPRRAFRRQVATPSDPRMAHARRALRDAVGCSDRTGVTGLAHRAMTAPQHREFDWLMIDRQEPRTRCLNRIFGTIVAPARGSKVKHQANEPIRIAYASEYARAHPALVLEMPANIRNATGTNLVGLITRRSRVRIPPPLLRNSWKSRPPRDRRFRRQGRLLV